MSEISSFSLCFWHRLRLEAWRSVATSASNSILVEEANGVKRVFNPGIYVKVDHHKGLFCVRHLLSSSSEGQNCGGDTTFSLGALLHDSTTQTKKIFQFCITEDLIENLLGTHLGTHSISPIIFDYIGDLIPRILYTLVCKIQNLALMSGNLVCSSQFSIFWNLVPFKITISGQPQFLVKSYSERTVPTVAFEKREKVAENENGSALVAFHRSTSWLSYGAIMNNFNEHFPSAPSLLLDPSIDLLLAPELSLAENPEAF